MPRVYLSLGSNVDAESNIRLGIRELRKRFRKLDISPAYRSKAVGFDGDDFLNLVVGFDTRAYIETIVRHIERIHRIAGRQRGEQKFSPRTLDIDLLTYGDIVTSVPPVTLPRGDVLEYDFVLKPLADIAADELHPVTGRSYADHWEEMKRSGSGLRRVDIDLD
jgi:2-amino-4-hydroxy-6-hydroxymethyldihydropteridine diphosphokinase